MENVGAEKIKIKRKKVSNKWELNFDINNNKDNQVCLVLLGFRVEGWSDVESWPRHLRNAFLAKLK